MRKIKEIQLSSSDVAKLSDWIKQNDPYEACALLIGKVEFEIAHVEEIILTPNMAKSITHFEIDPELLLKILLELEEDKNKELISVFHSHPTKPYPSGIDIPYMRNYPDLVWVIKGLPKTEPMHGFQWIENEIVEVEVKITP